MTKINNMVTPAHIQKKLKKITKENPDLPLGFIRDALISLDEVKQGLVEPYQFGNVDINNDD